MSSNHIYYVYAYLRAKDSITAPAGTPYYIGKGKDNRAWKKHVFQIPANEYIKIIAKNLSEHESFLLERKLISLFGRKDQKTGILRNNTDGGEGSSGRLHTSETKAKIGIKSIGRTHMIGRTHSAETKARQRKAKLGKIPNDETRTKMSKTRLGVPSKRKGMPNILSEAGRLSMVEKQRAKRLSEVFTCSICHREIKTAGNYQRHFRNHQICP